MNGVCKVCGCDGHCARTGRISARTFIRLNPGEHPGGNYGLLIEKMCRNCAHLVESKDLPDGYENYWECDAGGISERMPSGEYLAHCFKRGGFDKPNKTVREAQKRCPYFEVHPRLKAGVKP